MSDTSSGRTEQPVYQITFKRGTIRKNVIEDAQRADDWPTDELHEVVMNPVKITVEGTPTGIRWLFDWLHWAAEAHRLEDGRMVADECEAMAQIIWDAVDGELPDRQRSRRLLR